MHPLGNSEPFKKKVGHDAQPFSSSYMLELWGFMSNDTLWHRLNFLGTLLFVFALKNIAVV